MAVLTATQLAEIRRALAAKAAVVNYTKPQANAALQAVEDWFDANQASLSQAINTATAPLVLTVAQKKWLVAYWLLSRFQREVA